MEQLSKNPITERVSKSYNYLIAHKRELAIGIGILLFLVGYGIAHSFYKNKQQEKAHKSFAKALKYYDAKIGPAKSEDILNPDFKTFSTPQEKWSEVAKVFKEGFEDYKSAGIAPFFLVYQSEALVNLGKMDEAIDALKRAINLMSKKSASYSFFRIKLGLMLIDTKNQAMEKEGLEFLKEISSDLKNPANDLALYRLGEYFWFAKNYDEAKNYWNQLIVTYGKKSASPSMWASQAQSKLKLISVK